MQHNKLHSGVTVHEVHRQAYGFALGIMSGHAERGFGAECEAVAVVLVGSEAVDDAACSPYGTDSAVDAAGKGRNLLITVVLHAVHTNVVVEFRLLCQQLLELNVGRKAAQSHYGRIVEAARHAPFGCVWSHDASST